MGQFHALPQHYFYGVVYKLILVHFTKLVDVTHIVPLLPIVQIVATELFILRLFLRIAAGSFSVSLVLHQLNRLAEEGNY